MHLLAKAAEGSRFLDRGEAGPPMEPSDRGTELPCRSVKV